MARNNPVLLITQTATISDGIIDGFSPFNIDPLESSPTYTSYLKVVQYVPSVIVMELPQKYQDQLYYIQVIKQNRLTGGTPIICFGGKLPDNILAGLKKIGVTAYWTQPFKIGEFVGDILQKLREKGLPVVKRSANDIALVASDADFLFSTDISREDKITMMMKHVGDVMAFPFTLSMALKMLGSSTCSINELAKIIETDPAISAQFIKSANSVFYAGRNSTMRIGTVKDAIVRIGLDETRRMITGMAVMQLFDDSGKSAGFDRVQFWTHCLGTAVIAERLAAAGGKVNAGEAFLAGILHDFGIIMFDEFFPELFRMILRKSTDRGIRFFDAEREVLSVHHNDIVCRLFELWKIPERIIFAVVNHYRVMDAAPGDDPVTIIVGIANIIAKCYRLGISCDRFVHRIDNRLFTAIGCPQGLPQDFYRNIHDSVAEYKKSVTVDQERRQERSSNGSTNGKTIGCVDFSDQVFNPIGEYLQSTGHRCVALPVAGPYTAFARKCDFILIFTDAKVTAAMIGPLCVIERRCTEGAGTGVENTPVVLIVNSRQPPPAVSLSSVSVIPDAIELRMLDLHIDLIAGGKIVRLSPGLPATEQDESVLPNDEREKAGLRTLFDTMRHFREKCMVLGIDDDDSLRAAKYMQMVRSGEYGNNHDSMEKMVGLAAEYYRRAFLSHELNACEENIRSRRSAAGNLP